MTIEAEENRYHGDGGWDSDPEMFAKVAVTWQRWIGQSGEHLYAAQILLPHIQQRSAEIRRLAESMTRGSVKMPPSLTNIYFLHCAFCIENAFKGVITSRNAAEIESQILSTKRTPKQLLTHDLMKLAKKTGFDIGKNEEYMLTFLSRQGVWAGRYPLPLSNADNAVTGKLSNGNHYLMAGHRPEQVPGFSAFSADVYTWARKEVELDSASDAT